MLLYCTLLGYPIISDLWLSRFGSSHNVTDCQLISATVSLIVRCRELCSFCITYLKRKALGTKYYAKRVRWSRLRRSASPCVGSFSEPRLVPRWDLVGQWGPRWSSLVTLRFRSSVCQAWGCVSLPGWTPSEGPWFWIGLPTGKFDPGGESGRPEVPPKVARGGP